MLVMYLAWIILLFFCMYAIYDFKKAVMIWIPFQLLFNAQVAIKYSTPIMSLVLAVDICLFGIYFLKKNRKGLDKKPFLLMTPMIITLISYLLSSIFGIIPITAGLNTTVKYFIASFGLCFLTQKVINTKEDLHFIIKCFITVAILITTLGILESIIKDNPWLDFVYFNSLIDESTRGRMWYIPPQIRGHIAMRFGLARASSFFNIPITFGIACASFLWMMLLLLKNKVATISPRLLLLSSGLLLMGLFASNSKTGYVGLIFLLFSIYSVKELLNLKVIASILISIICILVFFPEYLNNFSSLFNEDLAEEGGGSSVAMRARQLVIALDMFNMNPIFGNGIGSINILKKIGSNSDILGAESSWMQILPERGIVGAFSYLTLYFFMFKKLSKKIPKKITFWALSAILVMETATGVIEMNLWCTVFIVVYKFYSLKTTRIPTYSPSQNNQEYFSS